MKKLLLLILLTVLTSCGGSGGGGSDTNDPPLPRPGAGDSDAALLTYVDQFEARYNVTVDYYVDFDTEGETGGQGNAGTTVGVCRVWSDGYREVLINKTWWDQQADVSRKVLIFHELGHCTFDRPHNNNKDTTVSPNRPESMMFPTINPIVYWYTQNQTWKDYYENELVDNREDTQNASWSILAMEDEDAPVQQAEHISPDKDHGECVKFMDLQEHNHENNE